MLGYRVLAVRIFGFKVLGWFRVVGFRTRRFSSQGIGLMAYLWFKPIETNDSVSGSQSNASHL